MKAFVGAADIDGEDTGAPVPPALLLPSTHPQLALSFWLVNCGVKLCAIKWQSKQVLFGWVEDWGDTFFKGGGGSLSHKVSGEMGTGAAGSGWIRIVRMQ